MNSFYSQPGREESLPGSLNLISTLRETLLLRRELQGMSLSPGTSFCYTTELADQWTASAHDNKHSRICLGFIMVSNSSVGLFNTLQREGNNKTKPDYQTQFSFSGNLQGTHSPPGGLAQNLNFLGRWEPTPAPMFRRLGALGDISPFCSSCHTFPQLCHQVTYVPF